MPTPYAGNGTSWPESVDILSGSDAPGTVPFNTAWEGCLDRTAWLKLQAGALAAQNWYPQQTVLGGAFVSTSTDFIAGGWDPFLQKWLIASVGVSAIILWWSYGLDGNANAANGGWTEIGAVTTGTSACVSADPSTLGDYWVVHVADDGTNNGIIKFSKWNGSSFTTPWSVGLTSSGVQIQKPRCILFGGDLYVAIGNSTGTHGSNANPICYTLNTTISLADPGFPAADWLIASNAGFGGPNNICLFVPRETDGSLTSGLYCVVPGFLNPTMSFIASNDVCTGLCWTSDAGGPCFLLAVYNVGSGKTRFYRSPDGASWAAQSAPTTTMRVTDMQALDGGLVVAMLADASNTGPSGTIFSPDGGLNWYFSPATFSSSENDTLALYERAKVVASPQGFLMLNNLWFRLSHLQRLPAAPLP